jgi:predicted metal-binding membrane protein
MTVLLVNDVMSLTTMAVVTLAITIERVVRNPERIARILGLVIIAAGLLVIARAAA